MNKQFTGRLDIVPHCPKCNSDLDGYTRTSNPEDVSPPSDGDLTVCGYCNAILEFYDGCKKVKTVSPEKLRQYEEQQPGLIMKIIKAKMVANVFLKSKQSKFN